MPVPVWLADQRHFYKAYEAKVEQLAGRLALESEIYNEPLDRAHNRWASELAHGLRDEAFSENDLGFWIIVLGRLARRLCRAQCLSYSPASTKAVEPRYMQQQLLLLNYSEEYTALEFVRSLHMETYYSLKRLNHIPTPEFVVAFDPARLRSIFEAVRDDPEVALDYALLLELPQNT
jgi:hypothetical protein